MPATLRVLTAVQIAHILFGSVGVLALGPRSAARSGRGPLLRGSGLYLFFGGFYGQAEHARRYCEGVSRICPGYCGH